MIVALIMACFIGIPFRHRSEMPGPIRTLSKSEWENLLASGHRVGSESAPVTIVEFSDFLCPHCKEFSEVLEQYRKDHPKQIQVVFHNFPLPQHPYARRLAASAECVAKTGDYGKYYSLLFSKQDIIKELSLDSLAKEAGVKDLNAFNGCMKNPDITNTIRHDVRLGTDIGLMQTPTIVINRVMYSGGLTYEELSNAVDYVIRNQTD
jgi:protein-disulfide isomerase